MLRETETQNVTLHEPVEADFQLPVVTTNDLDKQLFKIDTLWTKYGDSHKEGDHAVMDNIRDQLLQEYASLQELYDMTEKSSSTHKLGQKTIEHVRHELGFYTANLPRILFRFSR